MAICVLGDVNLDVVVQLRGPVEAETDTPAATSVAAGGQAANVAAWITALAAAARLPRLSVDLSSTAVLREYGVPGFRTLLARLRPAVVFANEAEAGLTGNVEGCEMVVKLGPGGVRAGGRAYPAPPVQAVDSTGAGDAFAAGYLVGAVTQGLRGDGPVELGLRAAARSVTTMGAMP